MDAPVLSQRESVVLIEVPPALADQLATLDGGSEWLPGLAAAIAGSEPWRRLHQPAVVGWRAGPPDMMALVGPFDDADRARGAALAGQLVDAAQRLRYVSWPAVEELVEGLAARLVDELGAAALAAGRVVPVPRGGLVVAGLLASRLGMRVGTTEGAGRGQLTVVVDDVALSGRRLGQALAMMPPSEVVVATLASHPALRAEAVRRWDLRAFVSVEDLADHAPAVHGAGYTGWLRRWRERQPDDVWIGHPDHIAFPWNEPESQFVNEVTGEAEMGWRVVPVQLCMKNRSPVPGAELPVHQHLGAGPGPIDAAPGVVAVLYEGSLVVAGRQVRPARLRGTGVDFWQVLVDSGSFTVASHRLADRYGAPVDVVKADLQAFAEGLAARGLLIGVAPDHGDVSPRCRTVRPGG
jgi:hypothetical protein